MNKILTKIKNVTAVFVLTLIMACAIAPAVQASNPVPVGELVGGKGNYRAKTTVSGCDDRGYSYNFIIYAQIKDASTRIYAQGRGPVSVESNSYSTKAKTYHAYGIGTEKSDITYTWQIKH